MRQPESWSQLCAWTLCLIGGAFVLLGAIWGILGLPVRNGTSWSFLPIGLALLLIGLGFALAARQWSRKQARLLAEGVPVPGEIEKVRHEVFVTWNRDGFTNWPGKILPGRSDAAISGRGAAIRWSVAFCGWNRPRENSAQWSMWTRIVQGWPLWMQIPSGAGHETALEKLRAHTEKRNGAPHRKGSETCGRPRCAAPTAFQ